MAPVNSYPFEGKKKLSDRNKKLAYTANDKDMKSNDISTSLLKFLGSSTICFFIYKPCFDYSNTKVYMAESILLLILTNNQASLIS